MLEDKEIDAIIVGTPDHWHCLPTVEGCQAGKHVYVEKPLANSEAQCLDLIRAAESRDLTFMVAYCMRYHPLLEEALEEVPVIEEAVAAIAQHSADAA